MIIFLSETKDSVILELFEALLEALSSNVIPLILTSDSETPTDLWEYWEGELIM
jgi:hypothetical protein